MLAGVLAVVAGIAGCLVGVGTLGCAAGAIEADREDEADCEGETDLM